MSLDTSTEEIASADTPEPFHIIYEQKPQDPTMWVGLCVNQPLRDFLKSEQVADPQMVVVVKNDLYQKRYIRSLNEGVMYLAFPRPGTFTISVGICWLTDGPSWGLRSVLLDSKNRGGYDNQVMSHSGEFHDHVSATPSSRNSEVTVSFYNHTAEHTVIVESANFAKPPARWRRAWVGTFYKDDHIDQCSFRRRSLVAIPATLFLLPLHYVAKLVGLALYALLGWTYGLGLRHFLKPGRYGSFRKCFGSVVNNRSAWFYRSPKHGYRQRSQITTTILLITAVSLVCAGFTAILGGSLWLIIAVPAFILALCALVLVIISIVFRGTPEELEMRRMKRREGRVDSLLRDLSTMSCDLSDDVSVDQLIKRRRTSLTVILGQLKDKTCKPVAR